MAFRAGSDPHLWRGNGLPRRETPVPLYVVSRFAAQLLMLNAPGEMYPPGQGTSGEKIHLSAPQFAAAPLSRNL
jgi:hypothetical protein